jgi:hypothetical protein
MWKLRRSIDVSRFGRLSILTLAVFALALSQTAFAKNGKTKESSEHYVFKVAVEKHLEEKLNKVLTEIAGEGNTIFPGCRSSRTSARARRSFPPWCAGSK